MALETLNRLEYMIAQRFGAASTEMPNDKPDHTR